MFDIGKNKVESDVLYKLNLLFSFMILSIFIHYGLVIASSIVLLYFFKYKTFRDLVKYRILRSNSFLILLFIIIFSVIRALIWGNIFGIMALGILIWIIICIIYLKILNNTFKEQNIKKIPIYSVIPFFSSFLEFLLTGHRAGYFFFLNPNYLGNVMMMCFLYNFNMMLKNEKSPFDSKKIVLKKNTSTLNNRLIWVIILILNILTIIISGSRSALISTTIGTIYLVYKKTKKRYFLLMITLISIYIMGIIYGNFPFVRLHSFQEYLKLRIDIIKMAFIIFSRTNFWLGTGNFYYYKFTNQVYPHSHNILVELVLSYGVVGALLILFIFINWLIKEIGKKKDKSFFVALLIAVFIHNFTDLIIMWVQTSLLFTVIISSSDINKDKINKGSERCLEI